MQSILVAPPKGSVLETRVNQIAELTDGPPDDDMPPELRELVENDLIKSDPRLWKHPPDRIARAVLIPEVRFAFGEEAAMALVKHPDMARHYAANVQAARKAEATAPELARKPKPETPHRVVMIILAEFFRVQEMNPAASWNSKCETIGENLGGPGTPINRNTIRRILRRELPKVLVQSHDPDVLLLAAAKLSVLALVPEILKWRPLRKVG